MTAPAQPTLETPRLILRPFAPGDAPEVERLAGDRDIASTTINIPHPYPDGAAEQWIAGHQDAYARGEMATFAIVARESGRLVGAIGLVIAAQHARAELGYWVGRPYWNRGYCTEAAREILRFAFQDLGLNRVQAAHFTRNPASGRVMQKLGMLREGTMRELFRKRDGFEDADGYAILRREWKPTTG